MESSRRVGEPSQTGEKLDRISSLPGELVGRILSLMPLKDAVRTSILSSNWRYKWTTDLSHLQFDDELLPSNRDTPVTSRLVKIVDSVLLQHSAPIQKFVFYHPYFEGTGDADKWFRYLSKASVKKILFACWSTRPYTMPSYLFQCQDLVTLALRGCSLRMPPASQGFKHLHYLMLFHVAISGDSLEKLISSCPLLRSLILNLSPNINHINIDAPNLKKLHLKGALTDVSFTGNTSYLSWVKVCFTPYQYHQVQAEKYNSNMCKFFADLLHCARLTIDGRALMYLSVGKVPAKLPDPLRLKYLSLRINVSILSEVLSCLCLLRSSPSLEDVELIIPVEAEFLAGNNTINFSQVYCLPWNFKSIKYVSVSGVRGSSPEMSFLEFLLSACPGLERMLVRADSSVSVVNGDYELLRKVLQFARASARAKVTYLEHNDP